jgi:DNA-binding CsgD family transcriptional regulator
MHQNVAALTQCNSSATLPPHRAAELRLVATDRCPRSILRRSARTLFSGRTLLASVSTHATRVQAQLKSNGEVVRKRTKQKSAADEPLLPRRDELRRRFRLTEREAEVALLLAQRRTSKEIARTLEVSWHTARRHTERVLAKLGISSRRHVLAMIMTPLATDVIWRSPESGAA